MAKLRRVGGTLESHRRIAGRRILLPAEAELCNTLGLTESEYFYFLDLTESKIGKRVREYEYIPDIKNEPTSFAAKLALQIIVGVVINVVADHLAPKPREPKAPPNLTTGGKTGNQRFAPQTGFNSVQELAKLGDIIPLVFTRRESGHGGIRINTKLIWSQMKSHWSGQQLNGLFLLSKGELDSEPDFAGYAIGDTTLANYTNAKLALYKRLSGGRILNSDRYSEGLLENEVDNSEDVFSVWWDRYTANASNVVSGTRTPGSQTQFGAFAPMANGMRFRVPYELVLKSEDYSKTLKQDVTRKRQKIETSFPRYSGVTYAYSATSGTSEDRTPITDASGNLIQVFKDYQVQYEVSDLNPAEQENYDDEFRPYGMEDVKSSIDSDRITTDNNLAIGDSYLIGSSLAVCRYVGYTDSRGVWAPDTDTKIEAKFDITDTGFVNAIGPDVIEKAYHPYELAVIQRVALGTISNNTKCQVTEIGIKSTVWRQITGFANVNSHPDSKTITRYEKNNGSISLGQMSKYINRYSFFRLQGRISGIHPIKDWEYIDGGIPFAVKGNIPQPQYNFIRINHSDAYQYEFRFVPYPGNLIQRELRDNGITSIRLFQKNSLSKVDNNANLFDVYYSGDLYVLTGNRASNSEWYLGELPKTDSYDTKVLGLSKTDNGNGIPVSKGWLLEEARGYKYDSSDYDVIDGVKWEYPYQKNASKNGRSINARFYWKGSSVGSINKRQPGSLPHKKGSAVPWPSRFVGVSDNEEWSVESNGYQYRIGSISFGDSSSRAESASIKRYAWENSDANTVYDDWETTTVTGAGSGLTLTVRVYENTPRTIAWEIKDGGSGYESGDRVKFIPPNQTSNGEIEIVVITDTGALVIDEPWPIGKNLNPYDAISDFIQYDAEQTSHLNSPEHELVYVNEMNKKSTIDYPNLAYAGMRLNSSKEWTTFSQFSAYLKKGIKVDRLINSNTEATNLFPEIAYTLLTDSELGAGELIGTIAVDKERMTIAAKFCEANGFYWDGVITEGQNLREFIYQMSGYCLLDFTILGGKFSLVPAVPYDDNFVINKKASFSDPDGTSNLKIRALFTDGNIKDLKVSFLTPEERQIFQGRALYRHETENGFPETKVVDIGLAFEQSQSSYLSGSAEDPIETFDMSVFCTSSRHAETFLRYALRVRQLIDHGITFSTTPQAAMFLAPGQYFRLYSESTHTSRFENGSISSDGTVQSIGEDILTNADIYYWRSGMEEVREAKLKVIEGKTQDSNLFNSVFTVKKTNRSDRVYKVESLSYGEEGLIEVAASHVPLTATGSLAILDWTASDFT